LQTVNITQTRGHSTCRKTQGKVAAVSWNSPKKDERKELEA
jgi:hypothetical protein